MESNQIIEKTPNRQENYSDYLSKTNAFVVYQNDLPINLDLNCESNPLFCKGDIDLLRGRLISIVGTRQPTDLGKLRSHAIAQTLAKEGFYLVSGLAKGIDTIAHKTALELKSKTIAVVGTPIHKIYPAENKSLFEEISQKGLILSPAKPHEEVGRFLFPRRNKIMAKISIATIIIEAGETSGVIHQAAECMKQKRTLIFLKSMAENPDLTWVKGFIKSGALVVENSNELLECLK